MPGTTPTTWLDALIFGTSTGGAASSAETTNTLGLDRLDVRIPPDQYRVGGLQIARFGQLLQKISAFMKGGTRLQVLAQSSNPFGTGEVGFWSDGTNPKFYNGTTITTIAAIDGLLGAYQTASATSKNIIGLTSTLGPVLVRDNSTPLAGVLFGVQNSGGTTKFLDVTDNATQ